MHQAPPMHFTIQEAVAWQRNVWIFVGKRNRININKVYSFFAESLSEDNGKYKTRECHWLWMLVSDIR
jgi:hypothetical protein